MEKVDGQLCSDVGVVIKPEDGLARLPEQSKIFYNFKVVHVSCTYILRTERWHVDWLCR
jgi:hypothetical protein